MTTKPKPRLPRFTTLLSAEGEDLLSGVRVEEGDYKISEDFIEEEDVVPPPPEEDVEEEEDDDVEESETSSKSSEPEYEEVEEEVEEPQEEEEETEESEPENQNLKEDTSEDESSSSSEDEMITDGKMKRACGKVKGNMKSCGNLTVEMNPDTDSLDELERFEKTYLIKYENKQDVSSYVIGIEGDIVGFGNGENGARIGMNLYSYNELGTPKVKFITDQKFHIQKGGISCRVMKPHLESDKRVLWVILKRAFPNLNMNQTVDDLFPRGSDGETVDKKQTTWRDLQLSIFIDELDK